MNNSNKHVYVHIMPNNFLIFDASLPLSKYMIMFQINCVLHFTFLMVRMSYNDFWVNIEKIHYETQSDEKYVIRDHIPYATVYVVICNTAANTDHNSV